MPMDWKTATLLLASEMEGEELTLTDSDECSSEDEEVEVPAGASGSSTAAGASGVAKDEFDYHKMYHVESRDYQNELLSLAKEQNIIICLPPGAGKTYIALKLTEHMLPEAVEQKKKVVFLANTVPLVNQQTKYFSANLVSTATQDDNCVRALTGDLNVDIWTQEQWNAVMNSCHILVMSTQILFDALKHGFVKWNQLALVILDECHHARGGHTMAKLMEKYKERLANGDSKSNLPKILGLTATIIKGKSARESIPTDIAEIESLLCSKAVTHKDYEEVLKHSTENILKTLTFRPKYSRKESICEDITTFIKLLEKLPKDYCSEILLMERVSHPSFTSEDQLYSSKKGVPVKIKTFLNDLLNTYEELGPYCCKMAGIYTKIYLSQWIQQVDDVMPSCGEEDDVVEESEEMRVVVLLLNAHTVVDHFMKKLDEKMAAEAAAINKNDEKDREVYFVRHCISDKLNVLWNLLKNRGSCEGGDNKDLCGIVFCRRRIIALVLRWYLQSASELWPQELGFLKPELMVGHSTIIQNTQASLFTAKKQTAIIDRFHAKELNLLVATNVVEEGLNVPSCNLVVRFDPIETYESFVQSMGRARKKGAICYALIEESNKFREEASHDNYRKYNEQLSYALKLKALHVGEGFDFSRGGLRGDASPIPPFKPTTDPGAEINDIDAISLVHRYCSSLSCDKLGSLVPVSFWTGGQGQGPGGRTSFKGHLLLPILSPVRDTVEGQWMPDKTLAKRSAYMEAVKKLYYAKELTHHLLPKPRSIDSYECPFLDRLAGQHKQEKEATDAKIGTRKRIQLYEKAQPKIFLESIIRPNAPLSVYRIEITLQEYSKEEEFRKLYNFDRFHLSYGILTTAKLDNIPSLRLLAHFGSFSVSVKKCLINGSPAVTLSEVEMSSLDSFQLFLQNVVYNVKNAALLLDTQRPLLIAPLRQKNPGSYEIDWDTVSSSLLSSALSLSLGEDKDPVLRKPDEDIRKSFKFKRELYENAILVPWYCKEEGKGPDLQFLCALDVLNGTNSLSEFDDPKKSPTFRDYYKNHYNVDIYHCDAPLILCKSFGHQLNFLTRKTDDYAKSVRLDITQKSGRKIVPELANIHSFPASLYIQGRFLPSVFHRIYRLLLANELRQRVATYFHWKVDDEIEAGASCAEMEVDSADIEPELEDELDMESQIKRMRLELFGLGEGPLNSKKKAEDPLLLEEINPLKISWETISLKNESNATIQRRGIKVRDKNFALPEPPVKKTDFGYELMAIDKINFNSFDKLVDFTSERGPATETVMEALTLSNAQDSISLEKLEVMGDSVLKLLVSLHIFRSFPRWDEGKMTQLRMKLISNLHLYQLGKAQNIGELLSGSIFIPKKSWMPCGFSVPKHIQDWVVSRDIGYQIFESALSVVHNREQVLDDAIWRSCQTESPKTTFSHSKIDDKSVADAMEAIIGAYYLNGGLDGAFRIMDFLGLRGPLTDGSAVPYSRETTLSPPLQDTEFQKKGTAPHKFIPFLKDLETTLCYKFKNKWLALEALTHPTFMENRSTPCYERLEFVGDAILDFLVTDYILTETKITDPGKITDLRAALVNNVTFGSLAVRYGFHCFLKHDSEKLATYIGQFAQYQEANGHTISDPYELLSDLECLTVKEIEVPKVLGDLFESLAGAIFVDSGMSIDTVWKVFYRLMKNELEMFSKKIPKNPLRQLHELFPGKVIFRKLENDSSTNPKSKEHCAAKFQAVALKVPGYESRPIRGVGNTTKQAKQAAAKFVIRDLKSKRRID